MIIDSTDELRDMINQHRAQNNITSPAGILCPECGGGLAYQETTYDIDSRELYTVLEYYICTECNTPVSMVYHLAYVEVENE